MGVSACRAMIEYGTTPWEDQVEERTAIENLVEAGDLNGALANARNLSDSHLQVKMYSFIGESAIKELSGIPLALSIGSLIFSSIPDQGILYCAQVVIPSVKLLLESDHIDEAQKVMRCFPKGSILWECAALLVCKRLAQMGHIDRAKAVVESAEDEKWKLHALFTIAVHGGDLDEAIRLIESISMDMLLSSGCNLDYGLKEELIDFIILSLRHDRVDKAFIRRLSMCCKSFLLTSEICDKLMKTGSVAETLLGRLPRVFEPEGRHVVLTSETQICMAGAYLRIGDFEKVRKIARSIINEYSQGSILTQLVYQLGLDDQMKEAYELATCCRKRLSLLARTLIRNGRNVRAMFIVEKFVRRMEYEDLESIADEFRKVGSLDEAFEVYEIADYHFKSMDFLPKILAVDLAQVDFNKAEKIMARYTSKNKDDICLAISERFAINGRMEEAIHFAKGITYREDYRNRLSDIACCIARSSSASSAMEIAMLIENEGERSRTVKKILPTWTAAVADLIVEAEGS
jgi:hypothetical protein